MPLFRFLSTVLLAAAGPLAAAPLELLVTGSDGHPLPSAVVAVTVKGVRPTAAPGTLVDIAQRERRFDPMLTIVQTGTAVNFPNFDTVRHHVYSFSPTQRFEIKLYAGVPSAPVVFDKPGVATLGCNIHDRMSAWVVVVDTPLFAQSDAAGRASLDLPPGEHRLRAWHPALGETGAWIDQPVVIGAAPARLTLTLPARAAP